MPSVGFETMISTGERPQTYALDRAATGTGMYIWSWMYLLDIYFMSDGTQHALCYEKWNTKSTLIDLAAGGNISDHEHK